MCKKKKIEYLVYKCDVGKDVFNVNFCLKM